MKRKKGSVETVKARRALVIRVEDAAVNAHDDAFLPEQSYR